MNLSYFIRFTLASGAAACLAICGSTAAIAAPGMPTPMPPVPSPTPPPHNDLDALKARCNGEVQRRLGSLNSDLSSVNAAASLTASHRAGLQAQINGDAVGLSALDKTIQADTTLEQARADCEKVVTDYRVYVLEEPKIHEVIAADAVAAANSSFETVIPELQKLINDSTGPGKAAAQTELNDLRSKVTASETSISGVADSVIGLTPAGYPGNAVVLKSAEQNIKTAKGDLDGARGDINQIIRDLSK